MLKSLGQRCWSKAQNSFVQIPRRLLQKSTRRLVGYARRATVQDFDDGVAIDTIGRSPGGKIEKIKIKKFF